MSSTRASSRSTGRSVICRGVVWNFEEKSGWGKLTYAFDERGHSVIDAMSAALLAKHTSIAREIRLNSEYKDRTTTSLDFHSTCFSGGYVQEWPWGGQLVEVHLNEDNKLVSVWYQRKK